MYRYIETLYRSRPGVVIVSSDQADAYSHVDRRGAIAAGSECCLEVEVVLRALLSKELSRIAGTTRHQVLSSEQWLRPRMQHELSGLLR